MKDIEFDISPDGLFQEDKINSGESEGAFNEFIDEVYNIEEGQVFRKRDKLNSAYSQGYGHEFAPCSLWNAVNAITQVETSTRGSSPAKQRSQFARGTFGAGAAISKKAFAIAKELVS